MDATVVSSRGNSQTVKLHGAPPTAIEEARAAGERVHVKIVKKQDSCPGGRSLDRQKTARDSQTVVAPAVERTPRLHLPWSSTTRNATSPHATLGQNRVPCNVTLWGQLTQLDGS
jgi:hypothetical protein